MLSAAQTLLSVTQSPGLPKAAAAATRLALPDGGCWTVESFLPLGTRCGRPVAPTLLMLVDPPSGCQLDPTMPRPAAVLAAGTPPVGGVFPGERSSRLAGGCSVVVVLPPATPPTRTADPATAPLVAATEGTVGPARLPLGVSPLLASSSSDEQARVAVAAAAMVVLEVLFRCVLTFIEGRRLMGPGVPWWAPLANGPGPDPLGC